VPELFFHHAAVTIGSAHPLDIVVLVVFLTTSAIITRRSSTLRACSDFRPVRSSPTNIELMRALHVRSTAQLVACAVRLGLIEELSAPSAPRGHRVRQGHWHAPGWTANELTARTVAEALV
jgi:hypothetical protein